jgi:sterol desaturase/sphingolipid hydroxylase (fatty acid hydroxylase superfamily)
MLLSYLWRFHRVHHTDTEMDTTTAYRFHPVEFVLSSILRMSIILLLGLKPEGLLWYEVVLTVSIVFHHSNISIGKRADSIIRTVIVSPIMHKLHHSVKPAEFSSNYSSTLSIWDRLFRSWTETDDPEAITLGLNIYRDMRWQSYPGIMMTPFRRSGSLR